MENINWHNIRPWNGSPNGGFEELCVQLARAEVPDGTRLKRAGVQDAGVECYYVFEDGSEWGWQAKYFTASISNQQWGQIDRSVKTALDRHPNLTCYFVCVPRDRPDRRDTNQTSEMGRWDDHVAKWEGWARDQCMNVDFVWWGSSELVERLSQDKHIGRRWFWFDQSFFDSDWFRRRMDEAVDDAGPRYTPETHIDLPIATEMERFCRSTFVFDEVKATAIGIRKARSELTSAMKSLGQVIEGIDIDALTAKTEKIINALGEVKPSPAGGLPFGDIGTASNDAAESGEQILSEIRVRQLQTESTNESDSDSRSDLQDPFRTSLYYLRYLISELERAAIVCNHANKMANNDVLLVKGHAGSGKTHLLCDLGKKRLEGQSPSVLLLGQWFRGTDDPWSKLLQRLDLHGRSAAQFVGALEAAAQASNRRALVMIDALNEGNGRKFWPGELSSFLKRLEDSPWIAVVLSVRSSYEELLIPGTVRSSATHLNHDGFEGAEYDAISSYFVHHGIEIPSSPMLQPEFKNPLFLKTICKGLQERGESTIPLGFQGITAVFGLYLDAVNGRLATELGYDPKNNLVRSALDTIARSFVQTETRWCLRSQAIEIVNELLSRQDFSSSLYRSLVDEGVLSEDMAWSTDDPTEEVVIISYDRYADHIIADQMLRKYPYGSDVLGQDESKLMSLRRRIRVLCLNSRIRSEWSVMIPCVRGLPLPWGRKGLITQGLLEALCVQVPEKTGRELIGLEPIAVEQPGIGNAYLQSLVWRDPSAFSDESREVLNQLELQGKFWDSPFRTLLTVSSVPGHSFNADYLDNKLRKTSMAERDSWWSVFLHADWERQGAIFSLVNWATWVTPSDGIDTTVVDLAATTLAWSFTSSNRFLRDKATKALVALLSGRHDSTLRMLKRFADVDDPYVSERVYAVAYGVAMRSHDAVEIGEMASLVYDLVFAHQQPPAHILLRDHARGVIERAMYLKANLSIDEKLIRPPYDSEWPSIPSEECVATMYPKPNYDSIDRRNSELARDRIRQSVTADDFWYYVIGRDSQSNWMALGLDVETWLSFEHRKQDLIERMSEREQSLWDAYQEAKSARPLVIEMKFFPSNRQTVESNPKLPDGIEQDDVDLAQKRVKEAYAQLVSELAPEHRVELASISNDEQDIGKRHGPRFDKKLIQRYILGRVIGLGWTVDRFGEFDGFTVGRSGRAASKPERIGKKYQWIAYHEILAYIADHFQYRDRYGDVHNKFGYRGPWQEYLRELDPSSTLPAIPGGTGWESPARAWWADVGHEDWDTAISHKQWLSTQHDLPGIEKMLIAGNLNDGTQWVNVDGNISLLEPHPADEGPYENNRREIWIGVTGYFVRKPDAESFMSWAKTVDFWGRWMPESANWDSVHFGEYGWSPAYRYFHDERFGGEVWHGTNEPNAKCPVEFQLASSRFASEIGSFDCSIDESFSLGVPQPNLIDHFGLRWFGNGADYVDTEGTLAAFDPTSHDSGPDAMLIREDLVMEYLEDRDLALCWVVVGEKNITGGDASDVYHGRLKISGAYRLTKDGPKGFTNSNPEFAQNANGDIENQNGEESDNPA